MSNLLSQFERVLRSSCRSWWFGLCCITFASGCATGSVISLRSLGLIPSDPGALLTFECHLFMYAPEVNDDTGHLSEECEVMVRDEV